MNNKFEEGKPFDQVDLQVVLDCIEDTRENLKSTTEILEDLMSKLPEESGKPYEVVIQYLKISEGSLDRAHLDLSDISFLYFGDKQMKWESDDGKGSK